MNEQFKQQAANRAVELIQPGMVVGLGAGSTAACAVRRIAELLQAGQLRDLVCIPCSVQVEQLASGLSIPLATLDEHPRIDITIDGADEATLDGSLIKGGGGALLREKIVAQASDREVIVVDESKLSPALGTHWAVPIEVVPFGWRSQARFLEHLGARVSLRVCDDGQPYWTDQGNLILDCGFGPIPSPAELATRLCGRAGIVEHGLFLGITTELIVAGAEGVRVYPVTR